MQEAYIVAAVRIASGRRNGRLSGWHPAHLAASVLDAVVARAGLDPAAIEDVVMGCVTTAGEQSNNIARNAVLLSALPRSVPGVTVDRQRLIHAKVRSMTHLCRPSFWLVSTPRRAMRGAIPRRRQAWRQRRWS